MSFQIEIDKAIKEKRLYFIGDALPSDWYAAFRQWLPMAETGDAKAQYNIGRCYDRGDGVEQDFIKAKEWYSKAAEQNDPRAFNNLYIYYSSDKSNDKNEHLAEEYLQKAVSLNEPRALNVLAERDKNKQALLNEEAKRDFKEKNVTTENQIQSLLNQENETAAKQYIEQINEPHLMWVKEYLDYFTLEIVSHSIKKSIEKTYTQGGIYRGTTQTYVTKYATYDANILVKNNSKRKLAFRFCYEGHDGKHNSSHTCNIDSGESKFFLIGEKWGGTVIGFEPAHSNDDKFTVVNIDGTEVKHYKRNLIFKIPTKESIKIPSQHEEKGGCFVLTACYGDENHPVVMDFRNFRDSHLLKTGIGKNFVQQYYKHSPKFAESLKSRPIIKSVFRVIFRIVAVFLPTGGKK